MPKRRKARECPEEGEEEVEEAEIPREEARIPRERKVSKRLAQGESSALEEAQVPRKETRPRRPTQDGDEIPRERKASNLEEAEVPRQERRSRRPTQEEAEVPRARKASKRPEQGESSALEEVEVPRKERRSRRPTQDSDKIPREREASKRLAQGESSALEEAELPRQERRSRRPMQEEAEVPRARKVSKRPEQGESSALEEVEVPRKERRSRRPTQEGEALEQADAGLLSVNVARAEPEEEQDHEEPPVKKVGKRQKEKKAVVPKRGQGPKTSKKRKKKVEDAEADGAGAKKKKKEEEDRPVLRIWRDQGVDGKKNKNKPFTPEENEKAMRGLQLFLAARGLTEEEALDSLRDERQRDRKTWGHVASLADLPDRSVASIVRRVRRLLYGSLGRWTPEQVESLKQEVLAYCTAGERIRWKEVGLRLGFSEERVKDKWKLMCTETGARRKFGKWNALETWTLRQAVVELKNHLAPTHDIPWKQVRRWIPHRSSEQCRQQWFLHVLPQLLHFQDKHGQPIDDAVLERSLVRALKKSQARTEHDVNWRLVNTWWPARMNRQRWRRMQRRLPLELYGGGFQRRVRWLYDAMHCKQEKRLDHRLLKHAVTVIEAQAAEESGGGEEEQEEEDEEVD